MIVYAYDSRGRLESLKAGFAGETALLDAKYAYDGNGNRTGKEEKLFMQNGKTPTGAVTQYAYDSMNRLTMENRNGLATAYTYDMAGNRTSRLKGDDREEYRYNSRNQLTELTGAGKQTSYKYDPAGNLTQEQRFIQERVETRKYAYDAYNRNTEVKGENFLHKNFYDAEGLRNRIEENGKATDFVYSGDMLYSEKEESGTTERRYILGNEYLGHEDIKGTEPDSNASQKQAYSYITDEQGSLRYILNADRQIETYQEYSAFGERIVSEGAFSRLGCNSQTEDELTGLTYLRARYYNPATGRFTQEDVIYDDGFNLYAYCDSNPVIYCDPSGFTQFSLNDTSIGTDCSWQQWQQATSGSNADKAKEYYRFTGKNPNFSAREEYMGSTPSKNSKVGKEVAKNMDSWGNGYIRRDANGNVVQFKSLRDGKWYDIADADMSHKNAKFEDELYDKLHIKESGHKDAVEYWNTEGKYTGAKSQQVRDYMNNPDNYYLEYKGYNRSDGGCIKDADGYRMTYDDPEPNGISNCIKKKQ